MGEFHFFNFFYVIKFLSFGKGNALRELTLSGVEGAFYEDRAKSRSSAN